MSITTGYTLAAQAIPVTVAAAEAEAISFPRSSATSASQAFFAEKPFVGTSDRKCVSMSTEDPHVSGSLRSGDMIARGLTNRSAFRAGVPDKVLWVPRHTSGVRGTEFILRADRIGHPADSIRLTIRSIAGSSRMYGYPSTVSFRSAGQWLVVATAGDDWGCFVLDVSDAKGSIH
jgi:hypothetical protein